MLPRDGFAGASFPGRGDRSFFVDPGVNKVRDDRFPPSFVCLNPGGSRFTNEEDKNPEVEEERPEGEGEVPLAGNKMELEVEDLITLPDDFGGVDESGVEISSL